MKPTKIKLITPKEQKRKTKSRRHEEAPKFRAVSFLTLDREKSTPGRQSHE